MLQFGKYKMDANEIINQLREENERLKSQLVAVQDSVVHGKCANSEPCATFCEAIATRKMFKQLRDDRDAYRKLADSMAALMVKHKRVFTSKELKGAESHLAAHDAEVAAKAVEDFCKSADGLAIDKCPKESDGCSDDLITGWKAGNVDCRMAGFKYAAKLRTEAGA